MGAFGAGADRFDPRRELPRGVAPWGLSFGLGMHACIGQELAAGIDRLGATIGSDHLYGLVPVAAAAVLAAGATPRSHPTGRTRPGATRGYWGRYPVVFRA